jgi:hypothetical protein
VHWVLAWCTRGGVSVELQVFMPCACTPNSFG